MSSPCCSRRSRFRESTELTEPNLERQQSVLNLLHQLKGTDPLKQLFWSELNYERLDIERLIMPLLNCQRRQSE